MSVVSRRSLKAGGGVALLLMAAVAHASDLSDIGIVELRSVRPDLTGTGVSVGQVEATSYSNPNDPNGTAPYDPQYDANNFEEDPSQTNSAVVPTYVGKAGTTPTTTYNSAFFSSHATTVAGNYFGTDHGAAPGVAADVEYNANYFFDNVVQTNKTIQSPLAPSGAPAVSVVNQSFIFTVTDPTAASQINQIYDNYIANKHLIMVNAVGNSGAPQVPATAYNMIAVGDTNGVTSVGPTTDNGRSKPDISAPGGATSFSAPYVSGVAALLVQAGQTGAGGGVATETAAVDPRAVKALLLTGASKPLNWSHTTTAPLDTTYGAGMVNAYASYQTLTGGKKTAAAVNTSTAPVIGLSAGSAGWDLGTLVTAGTDSVAHYVLNVTSNSTLSSTLTWNRPAGTVTNGIPTITGINNLDLLLYNSAGSLVDSSVSTVDNVEYLYTRNLTPGTYNLEVVKRASSAISASETFGLGFNAMMLGDVNLDGHVDSSDLSTVLANFGQVTSLWTNGNFDGASTVDLTDVADVLNNFGATAATHSVTTAQSFGIAGGIAQVPEPATAALMALAIPALLARRRK